MLKLRFIYHSNIFYYLSRIDCVKRNKMSNYQIIYYPFIKDMLNKISTQVNVTFYIISFSNICYIIYIIFIKLARKISRYRKYFSLSLSSIVIFDIGCPNPFTNHRRFNRGRFGAKRERIGNDEPESRFYEPESVSYRR